MLNSRKLEDLHEVVQSVCQTHIANCAKRGVGIILTSTLRDDEYQELLYQQGRALPGRIVTNMSKTGAHGLGLAYDVVPVVDGKAIWDNAWFWQIIGEEGKKLGLTWGGNWKAFIDRPHFELTEGLTYNDLRAGKRPSFFNKEENMFTRTLTVGCTGNDVKLLQFILNKDGHGLYMDGEFGNATLNAVKAFQKANKLGVDGSVGQMTIREIKKLYDRKYTIQWYRKYIQVIKFEKSSVFKFDIIDSLGSFERVPNIFKRLDKKPTLLFNGGLFDTKTGASLSRFKDEGKLIASGYYSPWGMYVNKDGSIKFAMDDKDSKDFLGFSPTMLLDGKRVVDTKNLSKSFLNSRHPRTAFAESKDFYYIIMAHGRRKWLLHRGMNIPELTDFCQNELEAINAGNFDGGGSCMVLGDDGRILNTYLEVRGIDNTVGVFLR